MKRNSELLNLILTDICKFKEILTWGENIYFITFIDDFSKYAYVTCRKNKVKHLKNFPPMLNEVQNCFGRKIKIFKSDRGWELVWFFFFFFLNCIILRVDIKKVEKITSSFFFYSIFFLYIRKIHFWISTLESKNFSFFFFFFFFNVVSLYPLNLFHNFHPFHWLKCNNLDMF